MDARKSYPGAYAKTYNGTGDIVGSTCSSKLDYLQRQKHQIFSNSDSVWKTMGDKGIWSEDQNEICRFLLVNFAGDLQRIPIYALPGDLTFQGHL